MRHANPLPLAILAAALTLCGCAVTQVAPPPPAAAPPQFREGWQRAAVDAGSVPDAWWTLFGDPVLDGLQAQLVIGNENLKAAAAQVASARAALAAASDARLPTLSATAAATRGATPPAGAADNVSLLANAGWETDLWGRLALATRGAQATLQASADDLAAARLSAQALLAQTYFSLRTADAQVALLVRTVDADQRALDLTQTRYDAGVAARTDVLQAETQLRSAQAQQAETVAQRAQLEHAIAVLLGTPPTALVLAQAPALPAPPVVPALLPATLLQRRPDIAAAERRVAAAYAQIGVADAAWFPDLSLSASAGYRASALANLVSAPNLLWSLGSSVTQAVFDGGQRRLASDQARASADQATATYRQTVLTALQEVEDNLVLATQLQDEARLQQQALQAAQRTLQITLDQYRAGTVSYLNVATAQTTALSTEISLLTVQNRQLAAVNTLLKNIAGRWESAAAR